MGCRSDKVLSDRGSPKHSNFPSALITKPSQLVRGAVSHEDRRSSLPSQTETSPQELEGWTLVSSKGYRSEHNTLHSSQKFFQKNDRNITTKVSNSGYNESLRGTHENLPKGVVRLCDHFLQGQKVSSHPAYCCFSCSKNSKFHYGIWRRSKMKWQVMRPRPRDVHVAVPFQICRHYRNGSECRPSCKFAHGEEELTLWTTQRQAGRYD